MAVGVLVSFLVLCSTFSTSELEESTVDQQLGVSWNGDETKPDITNPIADLLTPKQTIYKTDS